MGAVFGAVGFMAMVVGGLLFLPLSSLRQSRKTAKRLLIGGFAVFVIGLIISPTPPATEANSTAAVDPKATGKPATAAPVEKVDDKAEEKASVVSNYRQVLALAKNCDPAIGAVGKAAETNSLVALYSAAKDGQAACQETWLEIQKLDAESGEAEEKAIETCGSAYFLRQRAMETAMKIADGDAKASNVVSFQDDLKSGEAGVMLCVVQWLQAGNALGLTSEQMNAGKS